MTNPQITVELLDMFEASGLTNANFAHIHHMVGETIEGHRAYCRNRTRSFRVGRPNETVQRRLAYMLTWYRPGDDLDELAREAARRVPMPDF